MRVYVASDMPRTIGTNPLIAGREEWTPLYHSRGRGRLQVDGDDLVIENGGPGDREFEAAILDSGDFPGDQELNFFRARAGGQTETDGLLADGNELAVGAFHRHGIG